jgi:hypothetical protein
MDFLQLAVLGQHLHNDEARSALPDAPMRAVEEARFARTRVVAARVLHRVADAVAPEPRTRRPILAGAQK